MLSEAVRRQDIWLAPGRTTLKSGLLDSAQEKEFLLPDRNFLEQHRKHKSNLYFLINF